MKVVSFKKLTVNDIAKVRELFFACNDYFQLIDGVTVCGCRAGVEFELTLAKPHGRVYGIYHKEILVGVFFIIGNYPKEGQLNVSLLLVHPEYRSSGIGVEVVRFIEDKAVELGLYTLIIGVDEINKRAIQFWKSHGFQETGEQKLYHHVMRAGNILYLEKVLAD
ncbi:GNAT family N-acetyltransferase [Desulfuribacillus alkaliarsenatis]|uniref:N-acetyltransferase domain-containing protein n=1 Tax=Desulfuribacillus alkaliarsenatis TaxID=766136 RepID=A0A1E5G0R2_9FIRM|nr:GNAT family N-acetyltransferase [Desulfuribacillus alkaliarsenatis]OEF96508.1 hypothetical protein BHF68_07590 [Desulfuribacillus alkaliarsenatis]